VYLRSCQRGVCESLARGALLSSLLGSDSTVLRTWGKRTSPPAITKPQFRSPWRRHATRSVGGSCSGPSRACDPSQPPALFTGFLLHGEALGLLMVLTVR
jgi:hypothetical protein